MSTFTGIKYPTLPTMNLGSPTQMNYKPTYGANTQIGKFIAGMGKYLTPMDQFSAKNPYETYAAPQREVLNTWATQMLRPEFERYTLNPFKQGWGNTAAASNMSYQPAQAQALYKNSLAQTEQPFYNQLEQAKGSWEDLIRQSYEGRLKDYYNNPGAFNNIGA